MFFRSLGAQHRPFYTLRNISCHLGLAKPNTRDSRLDLLLLGASQGRSGCGAAALWCTTHAGFAPCSPTFRVPLCTSHANSADVFADLFGRAARNAHSRKRRSQCGPHHAEGTPYVGELRFWPSGWTPKLPSIPFVFAACINLL